MMTPRGEPKFGFKSSPFPLLDDFILSLVRREGVLGGIRRWTYFEEELIISYDISHYRYCERIQRHHKSNNIILVANLEKRIFYQKCHDPDCRAALFRSQDYLLPTHTVPIEITNHHVATDDMTDQELMIAAEESELLSDVYDIESKNNGANT